MFHPPLTLDFVDCYSDTIDTPNRLRAMGVWLRLRSYVWPKRKEKGRTVEWTLFETSTGAVLHESRAIMERLEQLVGREPRDAREHADRPAINPLCYAMAARCAQRIRRYGDDLYSCYHSTDHWFQAVDATGLMVGAAQWMAPETIQWLTCDPCDPTPPSDLPLHDSDDESSDSDDE